MLDEARGYMIKCPYCFGEFPQEHTIFRANKGFNKYELDLEDDGYGGLLGGSVRSSSDDPRSLFRKFDSEDSGGSDKKLDQRLIDFWKDRGGSSGYVNVDKQWDFPHIDPTSPDFQNMISMEPLGPFVPDSDGFVRDRDGFIVRVLDKYSGSLTSMTRLCPHCHNPLPIADYGKYPVKFVSVVGITSAGKTVYLNQLLTRFSEVVKGTGYVVGPHNLDSIGESVYPGSPLPASTDDKTMRRPLAVSLLKKNADGTDDSLTLVFYDIAGENCVNKNGDADVARAQNTIGHFIAYCDGMIFLLDPEQIPAFAGGMVRLSNIANVVNVMSTIRANMNKEEPDWYTVPVAVCLAKSDKLNNSPMIPRDNPIFSHSNNSVWGFDREENKKIDEFLRSFLKDNAYSVVAPLDPFKRRAFFAISAITCGVESRFEKYQNQYILDDENERKFQHLRRWVSEWNARTTENRQHYQKCPVRCANGDPIVIPYEDNITELNAENLVTEIRADSVVCPSIQLTLWDVASNLDLVGYPVAEPAPRRIGDPLKWILWKLGLIGPYFIPSEPGRKPIFMSEKKWQQRLEEMNQENQYKMKEFYGDPLDENG